MFHNIQMFKEVAECCGVLQLQISAQYPTCFCILTHESSEFRLFYIFAT